MCRADFVLVFVSIRALHSMEFLSVFICLPVSVFLTHCHSDDDANRPRGIIGPVILRRECDEG